MFTGGEGAGQLDTRQLSCYSCAKCKQFEFMQCENSACFGTFKKERLTLKSQAPIAQTRAMLANAGAALAKQCKVGEVHAASAVAAS